VLRLLLRHVLTCAFVPQVHHALCEMLTAVLTPLVRSNQPNSSSGLNPALLAEWHNQVLRLKNDIGQWANKHSKHIQVGCLCSLCQQEFQ
jgi:hypothetical protein